ncbi:hypothetical protein SLE2022_027170 [Rubroshorea leprosula]
MDSVSKQRKHLSSQDRPRMLKDFLLDDLNSCSSSGFKSLTRRAPDEDDQIIPNLNSGNSRLQGSRSKAAATTISTFQAVINAVKNIHFAVVKSPSILPRSLSRRLSRRNSGDRNGDNKESEVKVNVITVKDIMRWKSFHDLVDEKYRPVDFASSPQHCTTATVTTTTTGSTNTPCSSSGSSWCESDFTSEYSPEECGEKYLPCVGKDLLMEPTTATASEPTVGPEGELDYEDEEQQSPVSVLGFQNEEDDKSISSFNQSLANVERTKQNLMQKIQRFECLAKMDPTNLEEWMSMEEISGSEAEPEEYDYEMEEADEVEEKAKQLLNHVKAIRSIGTNKNSIDKLLLDLFREELARNNKYDRHNKDDEEMVRVAKAWMDGELGGIVDWRAEDKREIFVRDMDGGLRWSKFEEEEENVACEVECGLMNHLLDELLGDLFSYYLLPIQIGMTHA